MDIDECALRAAGQPSPSASAPCRRWPTRPSSGCMSRRCRRPSRLWEEVAEAYEAEHPGVKIEMQFIENESFKAKLPTLLQSSDGRDFFYSWGGGVLRAAGRNRRPADVTGVDATAAWNGTPITPASVEGLTFDGKIWACPTRSATVTFFYNKELLAKAGVEADDDRDLGRFSRRGEGAQGGRHRADRAAAATSGRCISTGRYLVMREGGRKVFDAAKTGKGEGFPDAPFVKAGEKLAELGQLEPFQPGYLGATWPRRSATFGDGKAAMILGFTRTTTRSGNAPTTARACRDEKIGRFAFPAVEGGGAGDRLRSAAERLGGDQGRPARERGLPRST